jgi:hypothetical protein
MFTYIIPTRTDLYELYKEEESTPFKTPQEKRRASLQGEALPL